MKQARLDRLFGFPRTPDLLCFFFTKLQNETSKKSQTFYALYLAQYFEITRIKEHPDFV